MTEDAPSGLALPGAWRRRAGRPGSPGPAADAVLWLDPGAREAVLRQDGRALRMAVPEGGLPTLLHAALAVHAEVPAPAWPDGGQPPGITRMPEIMLSGDENLAGAAGTVLEAGLLHLLANLGAARAGFVEGVHQCRVAVRRLRTGLALFQPGLGTVGPLGEELRAAGRTLGAARDWDVFCLEVLPGLPADALDPAQRNLLQDAVDAHRIDAHARLARALDDAAVLALVAQIAGWARAVADAGRAPGPKLKHAAPDLLARLHGKVRRRGRGLDGLSAEELHALRRAAKKLRYGIEFLRPVLRRKGAKAFLSALEALQEALGTVNDAATALHLAGELAVDEPALGPAADRLAAAVRLHGEDARHRVQGGWRHFARMEPFWA